MKEYMSSVQKGACHRVTAIYTITIHCLGPWSQFLMHTC